MGELDWLEQGHGGGEGLQPMIKGPSHHAVDRVSIRRVLRGAEAPRPRKSRRRTKALAGWLIYCCTAVGGTAAAFTVRDTLFPSLGAPTARVLWAPVETNNEHGSTPTAGTVTTLDDAALGAADVRETAVVATPVQSVDDQTVPSASTPSQGPGNSVDDRGSGGGVAPVTGTTVADDPSKGPGPGSTIADDPTESSTPASASTPPTSADTTSSSTTPTTPASPDDQRGKGGGGGGGGNGPPPAP